MAIAIAPSVIRLNVCPNQRINSAVMASVSGMAVALMTVIRRCRKNTSKIAIAITVPISIASRTEETASRTRAA